MNFSTASLWFFMKNKSSRLLVALVPFIATLFIWGTWETKFSPWVDKIYDAKPDLINFHKVMDNKITKGELTKDQAILIYKRNALDGQEADEEIAGLFKVIVLFSFLSLSVCMLVSSIRVIVLEIKSDWKL